MRKREREREEKCRERRNVERETFLLDLRKSGRRFSSKQKAKLIHASQATRGY